MKASDISKQNEIVDYVIKGGVFMALPQKQFYTAEDYWSLPEDVKAELIDGQIYYHAAPSRIHQKISSELNAVIRNYIRSKDGVCDVYAAPFAVTLNKELPDGTDRTGRAKRGAQTVLPGKNYGSCP